VKNKEQKTKILAVLLAASLVLIFFLSVKLMEKNKPASVTTTLAGKPVGGTVKEGDVVEVDYTGRYLNGTVFDTSLEEVANEAGMYNPLREYKPISFTIGLNDVVSGVEEALVGMKVGEEKTVTLPPEKAYGYWSEENVEEVERLQVMPRVEEIELDMFEEVMGQKAVVNQTVESPGMPWEMVITKVENNMVYVKHNIANGTVVPTYLGNSTITVDDENIYSTLQVSEGDVIATDIGYLKVLEVDENLVTLDANNLLAGQTIIFNLKLISINQVEDQFANQPAY